MEPASFCTKLNTMCSELVITKGTRKDKELCESLVVNQQPRGEWLWKQNAGQIKVIRLMYCIEVEIRTS